MPGEWTVRNASNLQSEWVAIGCAKRGAILRAIAGALTRSREIILSACSAETALTKAELEPEFSRMTRTLEMFAELIEDERWVRAAISSPETSASDAIGPNHDVRSMLIPLHGAVIVFGASNFPLAYGVCGGDTASALAAGCPVVVKEHPAHRSTGRMIAKIARDSLRASGVNPDVLTYVEDDGTRTPELAKQLVEDWAAAAVGFTGSFAVGAHLHRLGANRERPIPVYAEMGSVNPNVIFPAALSSRAEAIVSLLAASIVQRNGQQCTCPGIVFLHGSSEGIPFAKRFADALAVNPARRMLSPSVARNFSEAVKRISAARDVQLISPKLPSSDGLIGPCVLYCPGPEAIAQQELVLATEMFGPGVVVVDDPGHDADYIAFPGILTLSLWADEPDYPAVSRFLDRRRFGAGRVVFNGVSTGVRVAPAMVHGGSWPATNRPDTTAVGARAIERWCRPVCFQNFPEELLPPELRAGRPIG